MSEICLTVKKVDEAGYKAALLGLGHNKKKSPEKMSVVAAKLSEQRRRP
jgi:hypothetical protein